MIKIIKDDKTLYKMVEYIKDVNDYTSGYTLETFLEDKKTQDATVKKIELIGEMVSRLSDGFKTDHNEIQWRDIKGLRNIAVHQYDRISMDEIWDIVQEDIPVLNSALCNILEHEYDYNLSEYKLDNGENFFDQINEEIYQKCKSAIKEYGNSRISLNGFSKWCDIQIKENDIEISSFKNVDNVKLVDGFLENDTSCIRRLLSKGMSR